MERREIEGRLARLAGALKGAEAELLKAHGEITRFRDALEAAQPSTPELPPEDPPEQPRDRLAARVASDGSLTISVPRGAVTTFRRLVHGGQVFYVRVFGERVAMRGHDMEEMVVVIHGGPADGRPLRFPVVRVLHPAQQFSAMEMRDVTIPPGGMRVKSTYYDHVRGGGWQQGSRVREDFAALRFSGEIAAAPPDFLYERNRVLRRELQRLVNTGGPMAGTTPVYWQHRGDEEGGQGIEPHWFNWRRTSPGYALALEVMYRTANRMPVLVVDDVGAPFIDRNEKWNAMQAIMPDRFAWKPETDPERKQHEWRRFDDQHFHRAYRDAAVVAPRHGFARWYLYHLMNWQANVYLTHAGDEEEHFGWWSLGKLIENTEPGEPVRWCGRAGVHAARFASVCSELWPDDATARDLNDAWRTVFGIAADETTGVAFADKVKNIPEMEPAGWDPGDLGAQSRELQLAVPLYERWAWLAKGRHDAEDWTRRSEALKGYLTPFPRTQLNITTGESYGGTNPHYELMTHGDLSQFGGDPAKLREVGFSRDVEALGAQPLNSCRDPKLWSGR